MSDMEGTAKEEEQAKSASEGTRGSHKKKKERKKAGRVLPSKMEA